MTSKHNHFCLLIHCLQRDGSGKAKAHPELFIPMKDIEELILSIKRLEYRFGLPSTLTPSDDPTCVFTFDDGYFNNSCFLELAEKHDVPFILFLNSYNIIHQVPFIWDVWEATRDEKWGFSSAHYQSLYENLSPSEKASLMNDDHRPFTLQELTAFAAHPLTWLGPHTHTHQPLVGRHFANSDFEIEENRRFLKNFPKVLPNDLSLPCGLYTASTMRKLLRKFERVYTIDGGGFSAADRAINRISLVHPDMGGTLMSQIERSYRWRARLKRKLVNWRYSSDLTYRF